MTSASKMVQREPEQFHFFTNTRPAEGQFIISVSERFTCSRAVDPLQGSSPVDEGPQPREEFKIDGVLLK